MQTQFRCKTDPLGLSPALLVNEESMLASKSFLVGSFWKPQRSPFVQEAN